MRGRTIWKRVLNFVLRRSNRAAGRFGRCRRRARLCWQRFSSAFLGAFRPEARGDLEGTQGVVWTIDRDTPDIASPLLSSGRLYFYKGKSGVLSCVDAATGKVLYGATRVAGLDTIYASPVAAGGRIYLTDRSGTTVVISDSAKFEVLATNSVGETVDATPAPVDNELFIRGDQHLFCISES